VYKKPRADFFERFSVSRQKSTTVFLSSFCERFSSFFLKRRKKNAEIKHKEYL